VIGEESYYGAVKWLACLCFGRYCDFILCRQNLSVYKYRLFFQGTFRHLLKFMASEFSDTAISKHPAVALMYKRGSKQGLSVESIGICGRCQILTSKFQQALQSVLINSLKTDILPLP
jgi:hypothetical protein